LKWIIAGVVLLAWLAIDGAYKPDRVVVFAWLLSFLLWLFMGALLILRFAWRFIRR
jgi:hypothetical protein